MEFCSGKKASLLTDNAVPIKFQGFLILSEILSQFFLLQSFKSVFEVLSR